MISSQIYQLVRNNLLNRVQQFQVNQQELSIVAQKLTDQILTSQQFKLFVQGNSKPKLSESHSNPQEEDSRELSLSPYGLVRNQEDQIQNIMCRKSNRLKYYDKNVGKFALKVIPHFYPENSEIMFKHIQKLKKVGMNLKSLHTFLKKGENQTDVKINQVNRRIMKLIMLFPMRKRILGNKVSNRRKPHYLSATGKFMRQLNFNPQKDFEENSPF